MNEDKRKIKFRAWDNVDKKMLDWDYIEDFTGVGYIIDNDRIEPMQYTGLKDKNGKEIFEDDILKLGNEPNYQVIWGNGCWIGKEINGWDPMANYFPIGLQENKGEIIGNIYENPDLIKLT